MRGNRRRVAGALLLLALVGGACTSGSNDGALTLTGGTDSGDSSNGSGCTPGEQEVCYTGPAGTAGVGACRTGTRVCRANGSGFDACVDQVLPAMGEACNATDDDCDGQVDEDVEGTGQACASGVPGLCAAGTTACIEGAIACEPDMQPTVELCDTPEDESCDGAATCNGGLGWAKVAGGTTEEVGYAIATDDDRNVVVAGGFMDSISLGPRSLESLGEHDGFIVKLTPSGEPQWIRPVQGFERQVIRDVAMGPGDSIVAVGDMVGETNVGGGLKLFGQGVEDALLFKLEPDGDVVWAKSYGTPGAESAAAVAVDAKGDIYMAGMLTMAIDLGGGPLWGNKGSVDVFLARLEDNGKHVWSRRYGDSLGQWVHDIAVHPAGGVVIAGQFEGTIDFGDGPLTSVGGTDAFVARIDGTGHAAWSKQFGGPGSQAARGVAVGADGQIAIVGDFEGSVDLGGGVLKSAGASDAFLVELTAEGAHVKSARWGDGADEQANAVAIDPAGNMILAGRFGGQIDFGSGLHACAGSEDAFAVKLDPNGKALWSRSFGDAATQSSLAVAADVTGAALLTGYVAGKADFGDGPLESAGGVDAFVAKIGP
ncbi:hypothetical protein [Polyangium aurulentum]|uniref:hypothetical protein n=1 Tax=Polyangium aurulentum TaxID=2567896 RepID=UPI0010AEE561|nr:hypothetical protein [Polyangium aurulentum]UQA63365.1 hypothetical protein E8A73_024015 [Polyangium aurulentum]